MCAWRLLRPRRPRVVRGCRRLVGASAVRTATTPTRLTWSKWQNHDDFAVSSLVSALCISSSVLPPSTPPLPPPLPYTTDCLQFLLTIFTVQVALLVAKWLMKNWKKNIQFCNVNVCNVASNNLYEKTEHYAASFWYRNNKGWRSYNNKSTKWSKFRNYNSSNSRKNPNPRNYQYS